MFTSTSKLIAAFAISAALLTSNAAFAKNGSGKSGSGGGSNHIQSHITTGNLNTFKLSTTNINSSNHSTNINKLSGISKKPITLSQSFKDSNKDHKNSTLGISLSSMKSDKHSKDLFCKKDKCWFDSCYSKCCYPYYFGCYYPIYDCYDYCVPTYTTCSYTVVPN